jgi:hypothetical protein
MIALNLTEEHDDFINRPDHRIQCFGSCLFDHFAFLSSRTMLDQPFEDGILVA